MAATAVVPFDRNAWARCYAQNHLDVDLGTLTILYLPDGAPEREIRLIEINELMVAREADPVAPLDFGVGMSEENPHRLVIVDVTPEQWRQIEAGTLSLPAGWSLRDAVEYQRKGAR